MSDEELKVFKELLCIAVCHTLAFPTARDQETIRRAREVVSRAEASRSGRHPYDILHD